MKRLRWVAPVFLLGAALQASPIPKLDPAVRSGAAAVSAGAVGPLESVPEPRTFLLIGCGLLALGLIGARRYRS